MNNETTTVKHTPGPWALFGKYDGELCTTITKGRISIADVIGCDANEGDITPSEAIANAKLIAAAPNLLEVLKGIAKMDDSDFANSFISKEETAKQIMFIGQLAKAAIQKATI